MAYSGNSGPILVINFSKAPMVQGHRNGTLRLGAARMLLVFRVDVGILGVIPTLQEKKLSAPWRPYTLSGWWLLKLAAAASQALETLIFWGDMQIEWSQFGQRRSMTYLVCKHAVGSVSVTCKPTVGRSTTFHNQVIRSYPVVRQKHSHN